MKKPNSKSERQTSVSKARQHVTAAAGRKESLNAPGPFHEGMSNQALRKLLSPSSAKVTLSGRGMRHPVAESMRRPDVKFRVPTFEKLKSTYTDKDLKIPEAVIKSRVTQLLQRMKKDGRLKSTDSVATIVAKIFPGGGKIDEAEFNKAIDVSDRSRIYESVAEAETKVKAADKPKLKTAMVDAADLVKQVQADAAGLKQVFGAQDATAKTNYQNAEKALRDLPGKMDTQVNTDYNLDDKEIGLGGWASHSDQKMHLLLEVAQVKDVNKTKAILIHEASHFGTATVKDHVYYNKDGFFELEEAKKIANAAHYEELPRRVLGTSAFDKKTFLPGTKPGGGAVTREDTIKSAANLYLRKAWDSGVSAHKFIRSLRREYLASNKKPFNDNKALVMEMSKLMDLTIHEQAAGKEVVTTLDVTLSESIARGVALIMRESETVPFPTPGALTDTQLRDKIVAEAAKRYDNLLKDAARDKTLLDWLEAHYKTFPRV